MFFLWKISERSRKSYSSIYDQMSRKCSVKNKITGFFHDFTYDDHVMEFFIADILSYCIFFAAPLVVDLPGMKGQSIKHR